jgi:hypothetical protein
MGLTPNSSSTSYLSAVTFLQLRDVLTTGDLTRDDGVQNTASELVTDPILALVLQVASGQVEAACVAGQRYMPADLQALVAAGGNGAAYLWSIIADIAAFELAKRRWRFSGDVAKSYERATKLLDSLRSGENVLPFLEAEKAGDADTTYFDPSDVNRLGLVSSQTRIFGDNLTQYITPFGGYPGP